MHPKIEKARVRLLLSHPFFGSLVMKKPIEETTRVPTAAAGAHGEILVNPMFVENLSVGNVVFLLAHEAMHIALAHLHRMGDKDVQLWNTACDAVINDLLKEERVGEFIHGGVDMPGASQKTSEKIYEELKQKRDEQQQDGDSENEGGNQGQGGQDQSQGTLPIEDLLPDEASKITSSLEEAVAEGKTDIASAMQATKMAGRDSGMSSALRRFVADYIESKVDWWEILERLMTSKSERHLSWEHPNKRFVGRHYLPRRERLPSMGEIVVGIDTSGSISDKEMAEFLGHLNGIIDQCNPTKVHVMYCHSRVYKIDEVDREDYPISCASNIEDGGTDMCEIVYEIDRLGIDPEMCIILTDGYTPVPDESPCELVWVVTAHKQFRPIVGSVIYV